MNGKDWKLYVMLIGILVIIVVLVMLVASGADITGIEFHKGIHIG